MRDTDLLDLPVDLQQDQPLHKLDLGCLIFNRSMRESLERLMPFWKEASLRVRWLPPVEGIVFRITTIGPSFLTAEESDGLNAVRIEANFEEDEHLTHINLRMTPMEPLTIGSLITHGYADRWEMRLYALTDLLDN